MDTKLKNYRYSSWFKLLAIVLCVAGMLTFAYGLLKAPYFEDAIQNKDFKKSNICNGILEHTYYQVSELAFTLRNEEYIKSGRSIDQNYLEEKKTNINTYRENEIEEINNKYNSLIEQSRNNEINVENPNIDNSSASTTPANDSNQLSNILVKKRDKELQDVFKKYDALIEAAKSDCINEQLSEYENKLENLKQLDGIYYTIVEGGKVTISNIDGSSSIQEYYKELPYYAQLSSESDVNSFFNYDYYYKDFTFPNNTTVYLGMSQNKYNTEQVKFNENAAKGLLGIKLSSTGLLVFLIGLSYLIYAAGRRVDKEGVHLLVIDSAYLDITLAVAIGAIILCMAPLFEFGRYIFRDKNYLNNNLLLLLSGVIITIGTLIGILYVTMFIKRLKRHEVIKNTFIFRVCRWLIREIKSIYTNLFSEIKIILDKSPLAKRLVLTFGAYAAINIICILIIGRGFFAGLIDHGSTVFVTFIGFIGIGFAGIVGINVYAIKRLLKTYKAFKDIKDGAERIRAGELSYNIPEQGIAELRQLAETINEIGDGFKTAVSSQVKSERMKTELITNVSHDLKTPLTSIITYVDLLKNEGLLSENADKYLCIIDTKSQRLKALTEDLFEAAKASSGNISVNLEKLDIVSLINQGLGELSDKIDASGLDFRLKLPSEKLYVNADGKLLWRVIENLLSNVFKYALPNSRVYIDAFATAENVRIVIKNISAYELNINEDELMERFKRGDASRHSEGSGLGLSIAKSLTELQGGSFHIEVDGDLFKATVELVGV